MRDDRWIIHLPTIITSKAQVFELAAALERSLAHVTDIDFGETTLSEEHRQNLRHRLHCGLWVDGDRSRRCRLPEGHPGGCDEQSPSA
ncbi:hypothetical protein AB0J86_06170 [Micromonospora sp. NPDC049559]|uniref:hypothetical protein n=1 Tax=Micromonospora sp. NPDC049559 TaxID=3155923 RepID=UPI003419AE4E